VKIYREAGMLDRPEVRARLFAGVRTILNACGPDDERYQNVYWNMRTLMMEIPATQDEWRILKEKMEADLATGTWSSPDTRSWAEGSLKVIVRTAFPEEPKHAEADKYLAQGHPAIAADVYLKAGMLDRPEVRARLFAGVKTMLDAVGPDSPDYQRVYWGTRSFMVDMQASQQEWDILANKMRADLAAGTRWADPQVRAWAQESLQVIERLRK
jgi:hypothetical protein